MMSAKDAKKESDKNKNTLDNQVASFLGAMDLKVKEAGTKGKLGTDALTFPWSQTSPEAYKIAEKKLTDLGYKVSQTEHLAFKTFTITLSWE